MSALVHREVRCVVVPVGARCRLCRLSCDDGAAQVSIHYGPVGVYGDGGNPLAALNRRSWVCVDCLRSVVAAVDEAENDGITGNEAPP